MSFKCNYVSVINCTWKTIYAGLNFNGLSWGICKRIYSELVKPLNTEYSTSLNFVYYSEISAIQSGFSL